jgi:hypothetical protein
MWQRLVADGSMFPVTGTRRPDTPDPALGRSLPAPAPGPSTTNIATPEISITKHYAPSPTVSSASSTAAYTTTRSTTNTKPGHTAHQQPLDNLNPWDVYNNISDTATCTFSFPVATRDAVNCTDAGCLT